jgi:NADH-quinone oxidoreductase subunit N
MVIGVFVPPGGEGGFLAEGGFLEFPLNLPIPALLGIVAAVTMTFGNLAAIPQNNIKRLLAYSSIAHAGYLLMGFVVLSQAALQAVMIYLVFYYLMNVGAFTVCQAVRDKTGGEMLSDFSGLGGREPWMAILMTVFLVSLTGLPPVAGFIGKFYIFYAVIEHGGNGFWVLALIAAVNSAISLFYYFKIVKAMWFVEPAESGPMGLHRGYVAIASLLAVPTLVCGLYWTPVSSAAKESIAIYRTPIVQQLTQAETSRPRAAVAERD